MTGPLGIYGLITLSVNSPFVADSIIQNIKDCNPDHHYISIDDIFLEASYKYSVSSDIVNNMYTVIINKLRTSNSSIKIIYSSFNIPINTRNGFF